MKQKLIIFDMDGTLVNSSLTIANAINYVRVNIGFEPMEQEYILKHVNDQSINPAQFSIMHQALTLLMKNTSLSIIQKIMKRS